MRPFLHPLALSLAALVFCLAEVSLGARRPSELRAADYGITPGGAFKADAVVRLLAEAKKASESGPVHLLFEPGDYTISAEQCQTRTWFISNHDQANPRKVFLPLEGLRDLHLTTTGTAPEAAARFNLDGRIIPLALWDCQNITVSNLVVDYVTPPITQVTFTAVDAKAKTVTFRPIAGTQTELKGSRLFFKGTDFRNSPGYGILFEADGTIAYRTSDCPFNLGQVTANPDGTFTAANCAHRAFKVGQAMALRTWERPAPGIVLAESTHTKLTNVTVHYADGMALVAQACDTITLDNFNVIPNKAKGRAFTTQADATHFSGCKGDILATNGTYEAMMDDAINVHGTYLKVEKRLDDRTLECAYKHHQTYGIFWGNPGDTVSFVRSRPMEELEGYNILESITPLNKPSVREGAKRFRLTFRDALPAELDPAKEPFGIENRSWTPSVKFLYNRVANNRARGALFSTPQPVECAYNIFDHTSGCAVLLCGDCNGWYETGACADVSIHDNTFINALTSPFQFTEAVISIYPEIPKLAEQTRPFHRNVRIQRNVFVSFDHPLVYAKSVDGLIIRDNTFVKSTTYQPYSRRKSWLTTERCTNVSAEPPRGVQ